MANEANNANEATNNNSNASNGANLKTVIRIKKATLSDDLSQKQSDLAAQINENATPKTCIYSYECATKNNNTDYTDIGTIRDSSGNNVVNAKVVLFFNNAYKLKGTSNKNQLILIDETAKLINLVGIVKDASYTENEDEYLLELDDYLLIHESKFHRVVYLVQNGANMNVRNVIGETILHSDFELPCIDTVISTEQGERKLNNELYSNLRGFKCTNIGFVITNESNIVYNDSTFTGVQKIGIKKEDCNLYFNSVPTATNSQQQKGLTSKNAFIAKDSSLILVDALCASLIAQIYESKLNENSTENANSAENSSVNVNEAETVLTNEPPF